MLSHAECNCFQLCVFFLSSHAIVWKPDVQEGMYVGELKGGVATFREEIKVKVNVRVSAFVSPDLGLYVLNRGLELNLCGTE